MTFPFSSKESFVWKKKNQMELTYSCMSVFGNEIEKTELKRKDLCKINECVQTSNVQQLIIYVFIQVMHFIVWNVDESQNNMEKNKMLNFLQEEK